MRYYCLPFADEEMRMEKLKHFANHNVSNCTRRHSNPNLSVSKIFVLSTKTIISLCTYVGYREEKGMVDGRSLRLFIFNLESLHSGKKKITPIGRVLLQPQEGFNYHWTDRGIGFGLYIQTLTLILVTESTVCFLLVKKQKSAALSWGKTSEYQGFA